MSHIDFLIRLKNAQAAGKERVKAGYSEMTMAIAAILAAHQFIESAERKGRLPKRIIDVKLLPKGSVGIRGLRLLSTPGRHLYAGWRDLKPVRSGYGIAVLSTPQGILTNTQARKKKIGGELLFEIW